MEKLEGRYRIQNKLRHLKDDSPTTQDITKDNNDLHCRDIQDYPEIIHRGTGV